MLVSVLNALNSIKSVPFCMLQTSLYITGIFPSVFTEEIRYLYAIDTIKIPM